MSAPRAAALLRILTRESHTAGNERGYSNTYLKRLHPSQVRQRRKERQEEDSRLLYEPLPLKFPPTFVPPFELKNGWTPPPEAPPKLPFGVARTGAGNALPVYTEYKNGRTRTLTVVRKVTGDVEEFQQELGKVCRNAKVEVRQGGKLWVHGNHMVTVRRWLAGLGF
ncbi:unnamed protein product [Phaeothamnion confervicola]